MSEDTIKINKDQYVKLYAIAVKLESYLEYRDDHRTVMNSMAPMFLEDCEDLLKEYNKLRKNNQ